MDSGNRFRGGTWHRYKLGQAQFTQWLKQTADKLTPSTEQDLTHANGSTPSSSRSQKKAQKKAAKAGVDSDVAVHWRELETMATNIVENAAPEEIPSAPINILRDVIGLRKKSARFFSRRAKDASEETREKNATHEHIIGVLERVLAKFEAVKAKVSNKDKDATRSGGGIGLDVNDLNNMFEHLELEAAAEENGPESDVENQTEASTARRMANASKKWGKKKLQKNGKLKKQKDRVPQPVENPDSSWMDDFDLDLDRMENQEEDDEFDYFMMIYCFFEDFNLIRSYICERWCDYYFERSMDLNTLSIITNAAFELFHQMEHDLVLDMRRIGIRDRMMSEYEVMMMSIFAEFGMEHIDYDSYAELSKDESDERIYKDEWDWLASPAFTTIRGLLRFIPPGKTPMIRKSDRETPMYGATTAKDLDKFKDTVISDLLFDVVCIKALKTNHGAPELLPAESELLLGFQDALRNYKWSSAFIFSLQLYVDIRYILEDTVSHPYEQLKETASQMARTMLLEMDMATGPRFEVRRILRRCDKDLQRYMLNDVVLEDKAPRYLRAGLSEEDIDEFYLLKHEPVWAGLLDFRAKLFANQIGHEFVHRSFVVEAAAYLYAAARAASTRFPPDEEEEFPAWDDMEKFLASYTDDSALKRGLLSGGDDPVAIMKNFQSIAPSDLSRPKPPNVALDAVDGQTEEFKQAVRMRQHLSKRYTSDDRTNQFFMEYMQGLIKQRLEPEMAKLEAEDVSAVLRDITSKKPAAQPHLKSALPKDRQALADERVELRDRQRAAKRKALLEQLSPVMQIQLLEDIIATQQQGLLSIDFKNLFLMSHRILVLTCVVTTDEVMEKCGVTNAASPKVLDNFVRGALALGECLTGDADKDKQALQNLVINVKSCVLEGHVNFRGMDEDSDDDDGSWADTDESETGSEE